MRSAAPWAQRAPASRCGGTASAGRAGPTMTEVAAEAGVSQTTVSLVLNDAQGARLSSETRERVFEAAQRLGYRLARRGGRRHRRSGQPQSASSSTRSRPIPGPRSQWTARATRRGSTGCTISAAATRGDAEMEQAVLAQMTAQPLLGLIYGRSIPGGSRRRRRCRGCRQCC